MKTPKHNRIRPGRDINKPFLVWVSKQPCCVCGCYPCQAHHRLTTASRRKYGKSHDHEAVPLCFTHHQELHDKVGDENKFQEMYGVDFGKITASLSKGKINE